MPSPRSLCITLPLTNAQISSLSSLSSPSKAHSTLAPVLCPRSPLSPRSPRSLRTLSAPKQILFPLTLAPSFPFSSPPTSPSLIESKPAPATRPRVPLSWTWKCHLCHTTYKLGVTRRCLSDGHVMCFAPRWLNLDLDELGARGGEGTEGRGQRMGRKQQRFCSAEFDYVGWRKWGDWRREVCREKSKGQGRGKGGLNFYRECLADCDFPGKCLQETSGYENEGEASPVGSPSA